jgi:hypothetical protein
MTSVVFECGMWNCELHKVVATYVSTLLTLCIFSNIWFKIYLVFSLQQLPEFEGVLSFS